MEFVKIQDPDKPGDYLVLSKRDFDSSKHRLFETVVAPPASTSEPEDEAKPKPKRRG